VKSAFNLLNLDRKDTVDEAFDGIANKNDLDTQGTLKKNEDRVFLALYLLPL